MIRNIKLMMAIPVLVLALSGLSHSNTIDKQVIIQPIQITNGSFYGNQNMRLFEQELDKIWGQAGIDISFNAFTQYNSPNDIVIEYYELAEYWGSGEFWTAALSDSSAASDPLTINMWFTDKIWFPMGYSMGISNSFWDQSTGTVSLGANGIVISDGIFDHSGPGHFSVLAHELGHNLGLFHIDDLLYPTSNDNRRNLMSRDPFFAGFIDDIYPDGQGVNRLDPGQIEIARNSPFARDYNPIPEPSTFLLFSFGVLFIAKINRTRG